MTVILFTRVRGILLHESSPRPDGRPWSSSPRDAARKSSRGNFLRGWRSADLLRLLAEQARKFSVEVWAYCLMPNHVHLILTPHGEDGISRALGEAHRRHTNFINARGRWTGHLFQSRFASVAMDESHLRSAVSYVSLNPVRAPACVSCRGMGMVECAGRTLPARMTAWYPCVLCSTAGRLSGFVARRIMKKGSSH